MLKMERISFTRKEIYDLVWKEPRTTLAKRYKISDNGLRKICIKNSIPLPPIGYWQKLKYKKIVPKRPKLKKVEIEESITLCYRNCDGEISGIISNPLKELKKEIESDHNLSLKVPKRLSNPDPLIKELKFYLQDKGNSHGRYSGVVESYGYVLKVRLSSSIIPRALRIYDTFIKLAKARNHTIEVRNNSTFLIIDGISLQISLKEKLKIVKSDDRWGYRTYVGSGILAFIKEDLYRKEWKDGKVVLLEDKLAAIMATLEIEAKKEKEQKLYWEEQNRIREEEERIARELKERKDNEASRFEELVKEANRWHQSKIISEYLFHKKSIHGSLTDEQNEWIIWAKNKIEWYDPSINKDDEILGSFNEYEKFISDKKRSRY